MSEFLPDNVDTAEKTSINLEPVLEEIFQQLVQDSKLSLYIDSEGNKKSGANIVIQALHENADNFSEIVQNLFSIDAFNTMLGKILNTKLRALGESTLGDTITVENPVADQEIFEEYTGLNFQEIEDLNQGDQSKKEEYLKPILKKIIKESIVQASYAYLTKEILG